MATNKILGIELNKRNILIASGLTVASVATFILVRQRVFGKKLSLYISSKLEGRSNLYGTIKDYEDVFLGKPYIDKVDAIVKKNNPNMGFIKLKDEFVTKYRKDLYDGMEKGNWSDAWTGYGTDEEKIKAIIRKMNDKVAIAQLADSYQKAYGRNLLSVMLDEMDETSSEMKEINDIISSKLPFRLTKK